MKKETSDEKSTDDRKLAIEALLTEFETYQRDCVYDIVPNQIIINMIKSVDYDVKMENEQYAKSYEIEPRGAKKFNVAQLADAPAHQRSESAGKWEFGKIQIQKPNFPSKKAAKVIIAQESAEDCADYDATSKKRERKYVLTCDLRSRESSSRFLTLFQQDSSLSDTTGEKKTKNRSRAASLSKSAIRPISADGKTKLRIPSETLPSSADQDVEGLHARSRTLSKIKGSQEMLINPKKIIQISTFIDRANSLDQATSSLLRKKAHLEKGGSYENLKSGSIEDLLSPQEEDGNESCNSLDQESSNERLDLSESSQTDLRGVLLVKAIESARDLNTLIQSGDHWKKRIGKLEGHVLVISKCQRNISPMPYNLNRKKSIDSEVRFQTHNARKIPNPLQKSSSVLSLSSLISAPSILEDELYSEHNSNPSTDPADFQFPMVSLPRPQTKLGKLKGSWENLKLSTNSRSTTISREKVRPLTLTALVIAI